MTMGPGGGSDPGNAGRGGGSSAGRGASGGGGGGFGRDTPGDPNASDGKRGSSMGRNGGTAPDGGNPGGRDTPGHPDNPGRRGPQRGSETPGNPNRVGRRGNRETAFQTARERAKEAMNRHRGEGLVGGELGLGKTFSLEKELKQAEEDGTMTPRQRDMAIGMEEGMRTEGFMGSVGNMIGGLINSVSNVTGLGDLGRRAAGEAMRAATVPDNPASEYGAAVAKSRMSNSMLQDAAQAAAGIFGGTPGAMAASMANTAINLNENQAISELNADIDARHSNQSQSPGNFAPSPGGNGNTKASTAIAAMSRSPGMTASRPPGRAFGWSPVDIGRYRRNPMNLARNS